MRGRGKRQRGSDASRSVAHPIFCPSLGVVTRPRFSATALLSQSDLSPATSFHSTQTHRLIQYTVDTT